MEKRDNFGSSFGILVALAGSAVGLGNLWRFPYIVGNNGGAAFIIVYLIFVVVLCLPVMFSEFVIGRKSKANVFGAFKKLAPNSRWSIIGLMSVLCSIFILSFYCVVGGWTLEYVIGSISFSFDNLNETGLKSHFTDLTSSTIKPLIYHALFLGLTGLIVLAGIKKGIERYTKYMMPMLFVMVLLIAIRSITLEGAAEGLKFLFVPDFSQVTSKTFVAALGQAFFSLSIGCGTVITYASYVNRKENIMKTSFLTGMADTSFALIASMAVMPAVFAFGLSPSEGPGLVFITLPNIFNQIPFGYLVSIMFFCILFIAAITSSISILEVIVSYLIEEFKFKRKWAVLATSGLILVLGSLSSLSQGTLSDFLIFGRNIFDTFDFLSADIFMPLVGLLVIIFAGWKMKKEEVIEELTSYGTIKISTKFLNLVIFVMRYLSPIAVTVILIDALFL